MPLFGFDWSAGYVSPWQAADGSLFATPPPVVDAIVDSLLLHAGEAPMVELGSGDGRICVAAARRGVRCLGIELDPMLVAEASRAAEGLALVRFECADALTAALPAGATVVSYLLPAALAKIVPGLAARGARRMLSVRWTCEFAEWRPLRTLSVVADDGEIWRVHEYAHCPGFEPSPAAAAAECTPLRPLVACGDSRRGAMRPVAACATSCAPDEEGEWLGLGTDLFAAAPPVPAGADG
eukprot:Transcript_14667.p1 GENE.Transcript_14667~~Transcript_14667.p1  ORF type:complete len:239 (+),score=51.40 Transcript_14667:107-823(+)